MSDFKITTKDSSINLSKEELFKTILKTVFEDKDNKNLQFSDEYAETILAALGATTNKEFYNIAISAYIDLKILLKKDQKQTQKYQSLFFLQIDKIYQTFYG